MPKAVLIDQIAVANQLGEGVLWHPGQKTLWWTDILACKLYRYQPQTRALDSWDTPERLTAFGFIKNSDALVVTFASGFARYNPFTGHVQWFARPEQHLNNNRFNDGRVDPQGRFWAGTMIEQGKPAHVAEQAALYYLNADGSCTQALTGLQISNALCWSPDGRTLYHADSPTQQIRAWDYDPNTACLSNPRQFAVVDAPIEPDGACTDAEGNLWNAQWGGSRVCCYSPAGELLQQIDLPVSQVTCVAFGGPDLSHLYITSASVGLDEVQLQAQPHAGDVFVMDVGVRGLPATYVNLAE